MMIKAAGGPGSVSPLDFNERRPKRSASTTAVAVGIVVAAHVGVGVALYLQRFELKAPPDTGETIIETTLFTPRPKPPEPTPKPEPQPAAPNTAHATPVPSQPTETVNTTPADHYVESIAISTTPVPTPVPEAPPARPTPPEPSPPRVITNPSWASRPNAAQLMRVYPARAIQGGVGGTVTLNCLVQASGAVADCNVVGETEPGMGFDRAAQSLTRYFRVNPRTVDGAAEGSRVTFNLRFVPPAD